jgi:hypothetical protein
MFHEKASLNRGSNALSRKSADEIPVLKVEFSLGGILVSIYWHGLPVQLLEPTKLLQSLSHGEHFQTLLLRRTMDNLVIRLQKCSRSGLVFEIHAGLDYFPAIVFGQFLEFQRVVPIAVDQLVVKQIDIRAKGGLFIFCPRCEVFPYL